MERIAADIVILPDEAMMQQAIAVNRDLVRSYGSEIVLDAETCLPHVSLAMGCINGSDVDWVRTWLEELARETAVKVLRVSGLHTSTNARGQTVSAFEIERTDALEALHEDVMEKVESAFSSDVNEDMVLGDTVAESTLEWIRTYRRKAAFERFLPHITLGYGPVTAELRFPMSFRAAQLALCHLGNHCTCRRILAAARISG